MENNIARWDELYQEQTKKIVKKEKPKVVYCHYCRCPLHAPGSCFPSNIDLVCDQCKYIRWYLNKD